jgi:hypothetical protein
LECEVVRRRLSVQLATAVGRSERSTELLEDMALVCGVFGVLADRAGFFEVAPAASTILGLESGFDLDLALHVA